MKYFVVIGDGMADNPVPDLGGRTPLEAASKPRIDELAAKGTVGSVRTVPEGLPPGSDTAIMAILGCDPALYYTGRAPMEAAAAGVLLEPGSAAFRCNMVAFEDADKAFEDKRILSHNAGSIEGDVSDRLVAYLFSHPEFKRLADEAGMLIHPGSSFRHIAEQKNADIRGLVLTPPHDVLNQPVGQNLPRGCRNAEILGGLMRKAHELLDGHPLNAERRRNGRPPANGIWFWAEGTAVKLPSFTERYGKTGVVISAVPLCQGIAALTGMGKILVEGATGELDTNYGGKAEAAFKALDEGYDLVCVHLEAPDECTHNGDLEGKLQAIEWLDSRIVRPLTDRLDESGVEYGMLILSDHKTLISNRAHDGDPVPYLLYRSGGTGGSGLTYTEKNGDRGRWVGAGIELLPMLFSDGGR